MTHGGTFPDPTTFPNPGVADIPSLTTTVLLDAVCRYFGGPQNTSTLDYRTPTVAGLGSVRRGNPTHTDPSYWFSIIPAGTPSLMVVSTSRWDEARQTMGRGLRMRRARVDLDLFTRSPRANPTQAYDDLLALVDAVVARVEADPDCGSGGWEHGGLSFGDGSSPGLQADFTRPVPATSSAFVLQRAVLSAVASSFIQA